MFSNALDDNDFIVIASNEHPDITNSLVEYLKEECKVKGIDWEDYCTDFKRGSCCIKVDKEIDIDDQ